VARSMMNRLVTGLVGSALALGGQRKYESGALFRSAL
jgi:hypothetical protein